MSETKLPVFVGSRLLQVKDNANNISFPLLVQYPTHQPSSPVSFGEYTMEVSVDANIVPGQFPLVIISHGNGGSHLIYRTISTFLAKHGYIVAIPEHLGNNRNNNTLENTTCNLQYRPAHISLVIDSLLQAPWCSKSIRTDKIAVIGHSMGGYTALALAGGVPRSRQGQTIKVTPDPRLKAIVLMAPGAGWFLNSLQNVSIPILLLMAEHDPVTPAWNAEIILKSIRDPSLVDFRVIKNAGHFSFISPFPASMKNHTFPPSTDPEGFDREAFHQQLPKDILAFLNEKLHHKQ